MNAQQTPVSVDPVDIYNTLDRTAAAGPLRPVQEEVLNEWFANRFNDRDVILKLHTGEGKTLVGMLMLLSRLNKGCGPCLYVCPNKQLAEQAAADAKKLIHVRQRMRIETALPPRTHSLLQGMSLLPHTDLRFARRSVPRTKSALTMEQ